VREYVEDGRTGLVVPPGDADALAKALRWALDPANAVAVGQMAAAAKEVARTRFSPERYVETLLSVAERFSARS
jgi:glycosyltransferase involved in cell wall biosynthesis